jgi:hypothetical protein
MCNVSATQQCDPTLFSLIPHATIGTHLSEHSGFYIRLGCVGWSVFLPPSAEIHAHGTIVNTGPHKTITFKQDGALDMRFQFTPYQTYTPVLSAK